MTSPNGGEKWAKGATHVLTWNSVGIGKINIAYSTDNGASWHSITDGYEASTGEISWVVPDEESEQCLVRITDAEQGGYTDTNDGTFVITKPYITVIYPNGGEILTAEQDPEITWESDGVETVNIEYSVDSGATWNLIGEDIDASGHSLVWEPYPVKSMLCYIRISDSNDSNLWDQSDSQFMYLLEISVDEVSPEEFSVFQNYPNPFNPYTTITYTLPENTYATLKIYNVSGQTVAVLKDGYQDAGTYSVTWRADGMPSGLYFSTLEAGEFIETKKMLLLK